MLEAIFELFTKRLILLSINENVACVSEPLIRDLQINVSDFFRVFVIAYLTYLQ